MMRFDTHPQPDLGGAGRRDRPPPPGTRSVDDLWREHAPALLRYATLCVGPADAEDVVATVFAKLLSQPMVGVDHPRAYLFRSVYRAAVDQRRSTQRRQRRNLHAVLSGSESLPDSPTDIRRAVARLSVKQRAVVYFTYWEDLDSNQIAGLLDIAPATVRRHLARAQAHLRKALQ